MTDDGRTPQLSLLPLPDRVALLESRLAMVANHLGDVLATQRGLQSAMRNRAGEGPPARVRQDWETMPADDLADEAHAFGGWVLWLIRTYALWDQWPLCWYRHPGLVEELRALWEYHRALTTELAEDVRAAFHWHDALWRFRGRALEPVIRRCLSEHQELSDQVAADREQEDARMRQGFESALQGEVARRRALAP